LCAQSLSLSLGHRGAATTPSRAPFEIHLSRRVGGDRGVL
jgi:hypothetical protein